MAAGFSQINRSASLSEEVAAQVKESILDGIYGPGDALPSENAMADQFGVSRVVIREALKELKSKGFVETRRGPKGGPFVTQLDRLAIGEQFSDMVRLRQMTVAQLFQARILIEPEVVRLVLKNVTQDQIAALRDQVHLAGEVKDQNERKKLNLEFHRQMGVLSKNPFYALLMDSFMDFIDRFIHLINPAIYNLHENERHLEITEAIAQRDEAKALTLVQAHLIETRDKMIRLENEFLAQAEGSPSQGKKDLTG